jgi:hypothetical protein
MVENLSIDGVSVQWPIRTPLLVQWLRGTCRHLQIYPYWAVLSGLNRIHFTNFQFKGMRQHIAAFEAAPSRLAERLESLCKLDRAAAAEELRQLVEETVNLVEPGCPSTTISSPMWVAFTGT